jgi:A nuclease family of the HNH/ENDO VII superfamily with conserved AHH
VAVKGPGLPGSLRAAVLAESQGGFRLIAMAEVEFVAVSSEGAFTIALAPGAMAMVAEGTSTATRIQDHHIATIENSKSTLRGGPWTPRFQKIFAKAGMRMKDVENTELNQLVTRGASR